MKNGTGKYQYSIRAAQANRKPQIIANDKSTLANAPKLPLNDDLNTLFRQTNPVSTLCWYGWQYQYDDWRVELHWLCLYVWH